MKNSPVTSVVSNVHTYTIELFVGGAFVDKIGYQSHRHFCPTVVGQDRIRYRPWRNDEHESQPVISGSLMNPVPTIKAIPNVAGPQRRRREGRNRVATFITNPATFTDITCA